MSYAPIMQATMFGGLGAMPGHARRIAELIPTYGGSYEIPPDMVPVRASHWTLERPSLDRILVSFYSSSLPASQDQLLTTETFTQRTTPPAETTATGKPGVVSTLRSLFAPKPSTSTPGTTTSSKGAPSGPRAPSPSPGPGGAMAPPSPAATQPMPEWLAPAAIATVVLLAAGGLYWASEKKRRRPASVAANRRRRRRRPRR